MNETREPESVVAEWRRFLLFRAERRIYALPVESIVEVIRIPAVTRVPQAPKALLGVANLRGAVLPLASLRALLGMPASDESALSRAIVVDGDAAIAIAVDAIDALVTIEAREVQTRPADLSAEPGERLIGALPLRDGRQAAKILDIQGLLAQAFAERSRPKRQTVAANVAAARSNLAAPERETLITFDVGGQEFALDLSAVQEILSLPDSIAAMPRAEALVLGMMAFREQLLPLLSLRGLLGFAPTPASDIREKVVVTSVGGALVGLVADRARAVVSVDPELSEPVPAVLAARISGEARIKSIYRGEAGRRLISVLAPEQLFREDVMVRLGAGQRATRPQAPASAGEERKLLVFRLGDDEFALPVEAIDEVARVPEQIMRVPKTPKFLEGVVNLRGEVLPVVDQRSRFDMAKLERGEGRRLILVRTERHRAGLIVDSVSEVLSAPADSIGAAPDLTGDITRLVRGVVNLERQGRLILLLDPAELLTRAERGLLDAFASKPRKSS
jgi:purine-binding chemotaxis protein CheW